MAVGLLEHSSGQAVMGQPPYGYGLIFGERVDERTGYGMDELHRAASVPEGWFVYGEPVDGSLLHVPRSPNHLYGSLSSDLLLDYWTGTRGTVPEETAIAAVRAVHQLARGTVEGGRMALYEAPMFDWDRNPRVPAFVEQLRKLLGASEVIRDDTENTDDPLARFGTAIHLGFSGAVQLFLVERSRITYDAAGREILKRRIEAVKTFDSKIAMAVANELSLPEELRVRELLDQWGASDHQRLYVFEHADRSIGRDKRYIRIMADKDIKRLMEAADMPKVYPWWQRARRVARAVIDTMADSRIVRTLAGE